MNSSVKIDGDDIGEGDDGEKVDMKALAKNVNVREMEKVLKVCLPAQMNPRFYLNFYSSRGIAGILYLIMYQSKGSGG